MDSKRGKRPEPLATDGISIVARVRRRSALPGHPSIALGWKLPDRELLQFTAEKIRWILMRLCPPMEWRKKPCFCRLLLTGKVPSRQRI